MPKLAALVCLLTVLPFAAPLALGAPGAPFDPDGQDWEGLSQLVQIAREQLGTQRVVVTAHLSLHQLTREDALLLVHPEGAVDAEELSAFLHAGGRIVLLDDYGTGDRLLAHFGVRRVPLPARPAQMLRGNPALALAEPASSHEAVRGVTRLVTNHATGLEQPALSPVLVVRGDARREQPDVLLALAGAVGRGRFLAVGDGSVVINSMLPYPGNRTFAENLVHWATEDDDVWGPRNGKLYVLVNGFETTGSFGDDSSFAGAMAGARRALADAVDTLRRGATPPMAIYLASLALCAGLVAWASTRAGRLHRTVTPRFARPVDVSSQGGVAGRAAALGRPGVARVLAMIEMRSALEEEIAARLGLDRALAPDELAARSRAAGLLDAEQASSLERLLATLGRMEAALAARRRGQRIGVADVRAVAARMRQLLAAATAAARTSRDKVVSGS